MDRPGGRLADYLVERGLVSVAQVEEALKLQRAHPDKRFVDLLVKLGVMSAAQLQALFPKVALFERVLDRELMHFADSFVHERFERGAGIFHEGELGQRAYVLLAGKVLLWKRPEGGTGEIPLAAFGPGELFGELALLDGGLRSATAIATADCELMVLSRDDFWTQLKRDPHVAVDVFALLARRLRAADQLIASLTADLHDRKVGELRAELHDRKVGELRAELAS